jgi:DNA-binding NarL/FixJ family response regulator
MPSELLVVEDDDFTRVTLASSLRAQGFTAIDACATAADAISKAAKNSPRTALIDLHLGNGPTGLDVARALRSQNPRIGIVMLTSYDDPRLLGENPDFIPSGTVYLTKRDVTDISILMSAIGRAQSGKANETITSKRWREQPLNANQLAIVRLIAQGHSNAEIARRRGVSEKAIEATITRLAAKLDLDRSATSNQRVHIARVYFRSLGLNTDDVSDQ